MICQNCQREISGDSKFCPNCGAKMESSNFSVDTVNSLPAQYKPISAWGYFGWELLFSIPCAGLIVLIVFACGGTSNINLRNFARSYFCALLVMLIIFLIFFLITFIFAGAFFSQWQL